MALLPILEFPDPRLRTKAVPLTPEQVTTPAFQGLLDDMFQTMYDAPGIGLAASQVDVHQRFMVIDVSEEKNQPQVFINPEIVWTSDETNFHEEGCLSIPEYYEEVERPAQVRIRFTDLDGKVHEEDAEGLFATCIQHEIDHLNGVLFVDYLSKLKRDRVMKKFTKAAKRATG